MSIVTIPFDYDSGRYRHGLIPIYLSLYDEHGREIPRPWFDAVARVAEYLRNLARKVLGDVWRVSELADLCVQAQWRAHGEDFGNYPHRRIAEYARWKAADLRCGHWRLRRGIEILLGDGAERLHDPFDYEAAFQDARTVEQLRGHLRDTGKSDLLAALDMILHGCRWDEIAGALGKDPTEQNVNTLRRRYVRTLRRVIVNPVGPPSSAQPHG
jgi:hypothetical protein